MGATQFLEEFRAMHMRARQGELGEADLQAYRVARDQFERTLVAGQGLLLDRDVRRAFRVALRLPVELQMHYGYVTTRILDLSVGGFSAMMPHPMGPDERPSYTLELPQGVVLAGEARLASQRQVGDKHRVSFAFIGNTEWETERLEMLLIDLALERVEITS